MKRIVALLLIGAMVCGCGLKKETAPQPKKQTVQTEASSQPVEMDLMKVAVALLKKGETVAAVRALDEIIKKEPQNLQAYILLGQTYMHLNEFDRAVDSFRAGLAVAPDRGEIYYMLALANGLRGRKDLAVNNAEKALLLFQKDRDGENFKRALLLLQGMSQE